MRTRPHERQGVHPYVREDTPESCETRARLTGSEQVIERQQNLARFGKLAAGIAHDFNNILTGMRLNATYLREAQLGAEESAAAVELQEAISAAAEMCKQLLGLARRAADATGDDLLALGALAESTMTLLGPLLRRPGLIVRLDLDTSLSRVRGNRAQLQQVVMNLVLNAQEAIGDAPGTITVQTHAIRLSERECSLYGLDIGLGERDLVGVSVHDTGPGIPPDVLLHIFGPFFTTKKSGTGLGLATAQAIVQQLGGALWATSEVGVGTSFHLGLPLPGLVGEDQALRLRGRCAIWVQDMNLAWDVRAVLDAGGLDTRLVSSAEALSSDAFDYLLTDSVDGRQLEQIVADWPALAIVQISERVSSPGSQSVRWPASAESIRAAFLEARSRVIARRTSVAPAQPEPN